MNNVGAQIGDILGTVATILILSLPFVLIFFIVRNVLALKREMNETKQLEAARAEQQRKEVLQRQAVTPRGSKALWDYCYREYLEPNIQAGKIRDDLSQKKSE